MIFNKRLQYNKKRDPLHLLWSKTMIREYQRGKILLKCRQKNQ